MLLNIVFLVLISIIISLTILVTMFVLDDPVWRVASMAAISFATLFLTSTIWACGSPHHLLRRRSPASQTHRKVLERDTRQDAGMSWCCLDRSDCLLVQRFAVQRHHANNKQVNAGASYMARLSIFSLLIWPLASAVG